MAQILRLDDSDPRIDYYPERAWTAVKNSGEAWNPDGTYHQASSHDSQFYLLFRGTGISLYGRKGPGGATLNLLFDAKKSLVDLNSDEPGSNSTRLWNEAGLGDGDHQVFAWTTATGTGNIIANIWVDYFELENTAGTGFDPMWAGTNATNVPKDAIIVNSADTNIHYNPPWNSSSNARFYSPSSRHTRQNGATLTYTFEGVAIWYYADLDKPHGYYTVTIDDYPPERLTGQNSIGQITRQMLWSKTGLSPGQHTIILTHDDTNGKYLTFDYFRILRSEVPLTPSNSTLTSGPSTISNQAPGSAPESQSSSSTDSRVLGLAVGLPIGFIVLACTILFFACYRRRIRNRMSMDLAQDTTYRGGLLPLVVPHSLTDDRGQAWRVPPPTPLSPPASTVPPPYTGQSYTVSFRSPEMSPISTSPTDTHQEHLQDYEVHTPRILKK